MILKEKKHDFGSYHRFVKNHSSFSDIPIMTGDGIFNFVFLLESLQDIREVNNFRHFVQFKQSFNPS
ncbi:MAG: hypothetical protein CVT92_10050 [Bacteroidetes bacterium HGW-Bacteroidetes-1]|jgi:hypothetical protein|nr:MAG: hypothetical protein CVT92_10050 [Bacteroidetes bacterium HGW-Bacteroidetes-1]